jgi:hypothetical protein
MQPLKTISYRGGLITFRVPAHWKEEYIVDGGASFFEDASNTPTLRLAVITAHAPKAHSANASASVLASISERARGDIESLENGNAVVRYAQSATEQGQPLHISYWSLAQAVPPNHARIATFSYTLLEGQQAEAKYAAEIELIDLEIRSASFWPTVAILQDHGKPWWRFW